MKHLTRIMSLVFATLFVISMLTVAAFATEDASANKYAVDEIYDFHYASPFKGWCKPSKTTNTFGTYLETQKNSMVRVFASATPKTLAIIESIEIDVLTKGESNFVIGYSNQDIKNDTSEHLIKIDTLNNEEDYAWNTITIPVSELDPSVTSITFIDVCSTYYEGTSMTEKFGIKEIRFNTRKGQSEGFDENGYYYLGGVLQTYVGAKEIGDESYFFGEDYKIVKNANKAADLSGKYLYDTDAKGKIIKTYHLDTTGSDTVYGPEQMLEFHYASPFKGWCLPTQAENAFGNYLNMTTKGAMIRIFASETPMALSNIDRIEIDVLTNKATNFIIAYSSDPLTTDTSNNLFAADPLNNSSYEWTTIKIPVSELSSDIVASGLTFLDICTTYYEGASAYQGFGVGAIRFVASSALKEGAFTENAGTENEYANLFIGGILQTNVGLVELDGKTYYISDTDGKLLKSGEMTVCGTKYTFTDYVATKSAGSGEAVHTGTATNIVSNGNGTHDVRYTCCGAIAEKDVACTGTTTACEATTTCTVCNGSYTISHKGGTATCTEKAVCTVCNNPYGAEPIGHKYTEKVATDAFKASDATCLSKAKYYNSCICGDKGTDTFESGEKDMKNHVKNSFAYAVNSDGRTHKKMYRCCATVVAAIENHTYGEDNKCESCKAVKPEDNSANNPNTPGDKDPEDGFPIVVIVIVAVVVVAGAAVTVIFIKKKKS